MYDLHDVEMTIFSNLWEKDNKNIKLHGCIVITSRQETEYFTWNRL